MSIKQSLLFTGLCVAASAACAQSSVQISGTLQLAVARGNGGTTPIDGASGNRYALNDQVSVLEFSGKEDLGGGLYAGFSLRHFVGVDTGAASTPFWGSRSVVKLGGPFGEFYAGRSFTPVSWLALFSDPWYWDASAGQVGWKVQLANYTSTAYLRTNNTVGYFSPTFGGFSTHIAAAAGEGVSGKDLGASVNYKQGALTLGVAYDRSRGNDGTGPFDHVTLVTGTYDFGVIKPMLTYARSRVDDRSYTSYAAAFTAPIGDLNAIRGQYSHLNDWNTLTPAREGYRKFALGYQRFLSKRTNLFATYSSAKGQTASATNTLELGVQHSF